MTILEELIKEKHKEAQQKLADYKQIAAELRVLVEINKEVQNGNTYKKD